MVNPVSPAAPYAATAPSTAASATTSQPAATDVLAFESALVASPTDEDVLAKIRQGIENDVFRQIQKLNREHARRMKENA
jgi:hypothetical protein